LVHREDAGIKIIDPENCLLCCNIIFQILTLDPPFVSHDTLKAWQDKNHPWLELSDVHKETTENVRVTVIPFYMGHRENQSSSVYWVRKNCLYALFQVLKVKT